MPLVATVMGSFVYFVNPYLSAHTSYVLSQSTVTPSVSGLQLMPRNDLSFLSAEEIILQHQRYAGHVGYNPVGPFYVTSLICFKATLF
jgi:hypothetical protein